MLRFIKYLISANYEFFPPEKNKILVFDLQSKEIINKIFNEKKITFLSTRKEKINLFIASKTFLKFNFRYFDYLINYIKYVNPRLLITSNDNNKTFYLIKNQVPNLTTAFIQNGHRTGFSDIFEILEKKNLDSFKKNNKVDLMCVFNKMTSESYKKFISGASFISGSVNNNYEKKSKTKEGLIVISLFRPSRSPFLREIKLLKIVKKFCELKKMKLKILGKHRQKDSIKLEKEFFYKVLGRNFTFIESSDRRNSYQNLDNSEIVLSSGSTMGLESLGRGNRTAIIHAFPFIEPYKKVYWGYYTHRKKNGFFWTNQINEKKIFKILNNLKKIKEKNWKKILKKYEYETCIYDFKNIKLKRKLKSFCGSKKFQISKYLRN